MAFIKSGGKGGTLRRFKGAKGVTRCQKWFWGCTNKSPWLLGFYIVVVLDALLIILKSSDFRGHLKGV